MLMCHFLSGPPCPNYIAQLKLHVSHSVHGQTVTHIRDTDEI